MTRYLLRWERLFLKRHLLSRQGMIPLIVSVAFQILLLTSLFASKSNFIDNVSMVFVYTFAFGISQITTVYAQALQVTSSGLLGIAPVPARPRMIMAMFEMMVTAAIQAFVMSFGLGIGLMVRVNILGGLLVGALTFLATLFLYGGLGAGITAIITLTLPPKYRQVASAFAGLIYFILMIGYTFVKHTFPGALQRFADVFVLTAEHGFGRGGETLWFFVAMCFGLICGTIPLSRTYGKILIQTPPAPHSDSRSYASQSIPRGITRIFLWREKITITRNRSLIFSLVVGIAIAVLIPSQLHSFVFIYFGMLVGAFILALAPPKSLALVYTMPITPSTLWKNRLISLLPMTTVGMTILLIATSVHSTRMGTGLILCDALLPYSGVLGVSYLIMLNPSVFMVVSRQKQSVAKILMSTLLYSIAPLAFGALCSALPWIGVVVNAGLIFGVLYFGPYGLEQNKSSRYLFR